MLQGCSCLSFIEPGHVKMCLMSYANNKGADQPAHPRSLTSAFVVRCLDSIISLDSIAEISRLEQASVAAQAGLCLAWSETPEDTFCRVVAQLHFQFLLVFAPVPLCNRKTTSELHIRTYLKQASIHFKSDISFICDKHSYCT